MLQTWQTLGTQFQAVHDELTDVNPDFEVLIQPSLDAALLDWNEVNNTAHIIQSQLIGIPIQTDSTKPLQVIILMSFHLT